MINLGTFKIVENDITACDYEFILSKIEKAVSNKKKLLISPVASQTLVLAYKNKKIKTSLDKFDYLVPDSQWIKRALNLLYGIRLKKRVYGPDLMLKVCALAQKRKWNIFLYGTDLPTLDLLHKNLLARYPRLSIVGTEPSKYRNLTKTESKDLQNRLSRSGADILFIAIGSPNQEVFAERISQGQHVTIIPVGAAFDFISGVKKQAPRWMGELGFEWLFRLIQEPGRLWGRYMLLGSLFAAYIFSAFILKKRK